MCFYVVEINRPLQKSPVNEPQSLGNVSNLFRIARNPLGTERFLNCNVEKIGKRIDERACVSEFLGNPLICCKNIGLKIPTRTIPRCPALERVFYVPFQVGIFRK